MKNIFYFIIISILCSCDNKPITMEGNWVIQEMSHLGKETYPKTLGNIININYFGGRLEETITFNTKDSTAIIPGFNSEYLKFKYNIIENEIEFLQVDSIFNNYQINNLSLKQIKFLKTKKNKDLKKSKDSIINSIIVSKGVLSPIYDTAKGVIIGKYKMVFSENNNVLKLVSDRTTIKLINQGELISRTIDKSLNGN